MNALKTDTEKKIIQAAHEVFIEKGLEGARMQEIADRAGINKALLHYYFRSKDKLFDSVFEDAVGSVIPQFAQLFTKATTPQEMIFGFFSFYNNFFRANPYMPQFFFHEIWQHPDKLASIIKSQNINPNELVAKLKENLPPIDDSEFLPQHMIANALGMCLFPHIARPLFQRLFFDNDEVVYDKFLGERTDFLMKMFSAIIPEEDKKEISINPNDDF